LKQLVKASIFKIVAAQRQTWREADGDVQAKTLIGSEAM
jgi:hypothetical protein